MGTKKVGWIKKVIDNPYIKAIAIILAFVLGFMANEGIVRINHIFATNVGVGSDFDIDITDLSNTIYPNESESFNIFIENKWMHQLYIDINQKTEDDSNSYEFTCEDETGCNKIKLEGYDTKLIKVDMYTKGTAKEGQNKIIISVKASNNYKNKIDKDFDIDVNNPPK
ncbi:MAG: hypothetical protein WC852_03840 [Candidatus Nanoarchaeia archaeon]|jgi:hypothetical protein